MYECQNAGENSAFPQYGLARAYVGISQDIRSNSLYMFY